MELVFVGLLGAAIGSFLNVCVYRLPRGGSLVRPPSRCSFCGHLIAWYDNIPLGSYLVLGGRCRQCQSVISARYLGVEFLTAALFLLCYIQMVARLPAYPWTWDLGRTALFWGEHGDRILACLLGWAFLSALVVATFIDFEFQIIPDSITVGGLLVALVVSSVFPVWHTPDDFLLDEVLLGGMVWPGVGEFWRGVAGGMGRWWANLHGLLSSGLGALVGAAAVWLVGMAGRALFRKEAMGFGDVKFNGMVGALLGWKVAVGTLLLGAVFGAVAGLILLIRTRQSRMPFGPYLSLAAALFFLYPEALLSLPWWWTDWLARHLPG